MSNLLITISIVISLILAFSVMYVSPKIIDKKNYDEPERVKAAWTVGSMLIPLAVGVIIFYFVTGIGFAVFTSVIGLALILLNYERFVLIWKDDEKNTTLFRNNKSPKRNSLCTCGSGLKYKHCCGKGNNQS